MTRITLRAARVNCGYTQSEVTQQIGISVDTLCKYERDSSDIPYDLIEMLVGMYGIPFDQIFFGKESDFTGQMRKNAKPA